MGLRILGPGQAALDGEMTIYAIATLRDELDRALGAGDELEIDLAGVAEVDTAGLQLMLMAKRIPGRRVRFSNHSPAVLQLLELSNLAGAVGDPLLLTSRQ